MQVPANGQPILLMADCQTTGGYPRIAVVISADLPLAAQLAPGDTVGFTAVDVAQAVGGRVPILGVPTGVKMFSGVFGLSPAQVRDALKGDEAAGGVLDRRVRR